mgnify:CR=1 FL=1
MEVPYNTGIYRQMKAEGKLVAPVADWDTKRRWVNYAFQEFERRGYAVTSTTTVVRDPHRVKFEYRQALFSGADLLSIGVASVARSAPGSRRCAPAFPRHGPDTGRV